MKRRALLVAAIAAPPLAGCGAAEVRVFRDFGTAANALEGLTRLRHRTTGAWKLPQILEHVAQSIEYSMRGFPEPRSRLFQVTAGSAAFAFFSARGAMRHALDEPIPGAPALSATSLETALTRLRDAMRDFAAHRGDFKPHFAYGALRRDDYARAHLMHLANHWTEVVRA